jgi:hypothetical protein
MLNVADQFGEATYELKAGQHVLFEHGSLKEVVDHESSSCGCPPEPTMSVADALLHPTAPGEAATTEKTAAEQHPFPAAVSAGLTPAAAVPPPTPAGAVHTQVSAALSSSEGADSTTEPPATEKEAASAPAPPVAAVPQTAQPKPKRGPLRAVGRFFKRIFGGG